MSYHTSTPPTYDPTQMIGVPAESSDDGDKEVRPATPIRVLLADPEPCLLETYRDFLVGRGFDVATSSTGPECLAKLGDWKPQVLVLEPEMPGGWGDRILELLVDHPELRTVPVIVLTRRDEHEVGQHVKEFHVKPCPMAKLVDSIRDAVAP